MVNKEKLFVVVCRKWYAGYKKRRIGLTCHAKSGTCTMGPEVMSSSHTNLTDQGEAVVATR